VATEPVLVGEVVVHEAFEPDGRLYRNLSAQWFEHGMSVSVHDVPAVSENSSRGRGAHRLWDGRGNDERRVASGICFYLRRTGGKPACGWWS
jgi:hypothetical protein